MENVFSNQLMVQLGLLYQLLPMLQLPPANTGRSSFRTVCVLACLLNTLTWKLHFGMVKHLDM